MDDLFDDPGDLGFFFDEKFNEVDEDLDDNNPFHSPLPGEDISEDDLP